MGLLEAFMKKVLTAETPHKIVIDHESTSRNGGVELLEIGGTRENRVYTYYSSPLKGTRKGSMFYADVVTERVVLESQLIGTVWDTASDRGYALAKEGVVFGTGDDFEGIFRALDADGHTVRVLIRRDGMYGGKIPSLTMLTPTKKTNG